MKRKDTMKVDYHVHLEEGPYSIEWLARTGKALSFFSDDRGHTYEWMESMADKLNSRIKEGCFSTEWLDLYLERAGRLGLKEVGIVDHLYRFSDAGEYYRKHIYLQNDKLGKMQQKWLDQVAVMPSMEQFVEFIQSQKMKWERHGIKLKLGLEADFFPNGEAELAGIINQQPWDYVIGSVHFIDGWGFDNPETVDKFEREDLIALYGTHAAHICQAIESGLFDIIAHLDNLKVFSYRPDEGLLEKYYEKVAVTLKKYGVASEINTGLSYRYPIKEACPSPKYLQKLAEQKIPVTLSSDAHYPDDLGTNLDMATDLLRKNGYENISIFSKRKRKEISIL